MRRHTRKERGGDLPPATESKDLENAKKQLKAVPPGQGAPVRDAFGKARGRQGGRTRRRRRRGGRPKTPEDLMLRSIDLSYPEVKAEMIEEENGHPIVADNMGLSKSWMAMLMLDRDMPDDLDRLIAPNDELTTMHDDILDRRRDRNVVGFPAKVLAFLQKLKKARESEIEKKSRSKT